MKKTISILMMLALMLTAISKVAYAIEPITTIDLSVDSEVYLEFLVNNQAPNIVTITDNPGLTISEKIVVFDEDKNALLQYGPIGEGEYGWKDDEGQAISIPCFAKAAYAYDFVTITTEDSFDQLTSVTKGVTTQLNKIDLAEKSEGYCLYDDNTTLLALVSLEVPDQAYLVDETYFGQSKLNLAITKATENKPLYVLKDVTFDLGEYYEISKSLKIMPKDDDVTITLKSQLRLKTEETPIKVTFGGDDYYNLTILADMDQRWFATRNGILTFGANTFCDGRNHIYNVDGPFAVCQKVDGIQGQLFISGASIKNFRTTGNGGAILSTGGTVVLEEDEIGFSGLIKDCYAAGNGGAIYNEANGYITISDGGHILNCSALNGGGIYSVGRVLVAGRAQLSECTARKTDEYQTGKGGAIYMYPESGVLSITQDGDEINNPTIYYCSADKGGAIYLGANVDFLNTADPLLLEYNTSNVAGAYGNYKSIYVHDGYTEEPNLGSITEYLKSSSTKKYKATNSESTGEKISGTGKKGSKRTITPIEGKKVASVIVKDKNGNKVDVTLNEDGTYTFIQPASDVTVEVNYKNREITLNIGSTEADVDGEKSNLDVAPLVRNDRTMLPIRFVAENLGAKVEWNEKNPEYVLITKGDIKIEITLGSDKAKVNGKEFTLDSVAFAENDRTYLPVRFVSEHLNAIVEWNEARPMEVKIYER